jgi:hypothetical protein
MLQPGGDLDFPEEPFGAEHVGQLGPEDLDGHPTVMFEVTGEIDRRHPAMTHFPLDVVSVGKCGGMAAQRIRHPERFLWRVRCGDGQEDIQMQTACQRLAGIGRDSRPSPRGCPTFPFA